MPTLAPGTNNSRPWSLSGFTTYAWLIGALIRTRTGWTSTPLYEAGFSSLRHGAKSLIVLDLSCPIASNDAT